MENLAILGRWLVVAGLFIALYGGALLAILLTLDAPHPALIYGSLLGPLYYLMFMVKMNRRSAA